MIVKDLKIFSQNVRKNNFVINTILETNNNFDIIFIQELSWTTIRSISSSADSKGVPLVGVINHPNWLVFARKPDITNDCPKVIIFVNIRLSSFHFSFCKDIIDHRDIILVSFFINSKLFWVMNVYSDSSHSVIKYLKNTEINIHNILVMTGDFNIHDSLWDPLFNHHSSISNDLIVIANSFNLNLLVPINQVPTRYSDNDNNSNSVIDLMFLCCNSSELNNHSIHPNWHLTSDHALLMITIPINEENINLHKRTISKNSDEENLFIKEVIISFLKLDTSNILDISQLEKIVTDFANIVESAWTKKSKIINIMKHSKSWWNNDCNSDLDKYRYLKSAEDWKTF